MDKLRLDHPASRKHRWLLALVAAIVLLVGAATPLTVRADVSVDMGVSVGYPPPPLPLELQPPIPGPGYIWTPGYWEWGNDGYYWVPGFWVLPPYFGALWTPGYWFWFGRVCVFHKGYWGPHVGFYGGIHYGFGYPGHGYDGGHWGRGGFYYNRSVNQIHDPRITNVFDGAVANNNVADRTSFNGGQGGVVARPSAQDAAVAREAHVAPLAAQIQQARTASQDPSMRASFNHGAPPVAAAARSGAAGGLAAANTRGATGQATVASVNSSRTLPAVPNLQRGMVLRSAGFVPHASNVAHPSVAQAGRGFSPGANSAASHARAMPTYTYHPMNSQAAYRMSAVRAAPVNHAVHAPGGGHANAGGAHH